LRRRPRLRFGGVQPNPVRTGFKYIRKILSGCLPKLLSNLLLTHLRTSLAITCIKAPGLGKSAHNLRRVQKLVNQRQVHRSRKSLTLVLDEMVVLIGNYNKITVGPCWFTKRAGIQHLSGVSVKSSAVKTWLIPQILQRATDVNMLLCARSLVHRIFKRMRSGERAVERLCKLRCVVSQEVDCQSSNLTCSSHFSSVIQLFREYVASCSEHLHLLRRWGVNENRIAKSG
jgi:hypothetical protein